MPRNLKMPPHCRQADGFTLIELIIVMILLGIIGVAGAEFISQAFIGFRQTEARLETFEECKTALNRMEREIVNAVPNAVTLNGPTDLTVGLIAENQMQGLNGQYLEPTPTDTLTDSANTQLPADKALPDNTVISIYNLSWADFSNGSLAARRLYLKVSGNPVMVLDRDVIASSPGQRYYPVDKAVRYRLTGTTLERGQILIDEATEDLDFAEDDVLYYPLATDVTALTFGYAPGTLTRNAMITILITMTKNGEAITLQKEIYVRNAP